MHDVPLILTLTGGLSAALVLGYVTHRHRPIQSCPSVPPTTARARKLANDMEE